MTFNFLVISSVDRVNYRLPFVNSSFPEVKQRNRHGKIDRPGVHANPNWINVYLASFIVYGGYKLFSSFNIFVLPVVLKHGLRNQEEPFIFIGDFM